MDSPNQQRWFMMRIAPVLEMESFFVISHSVITGRKLAEQRIERLNEKLALLAVTDKLTGLANRMKLDEHWIAKSPVPIDMEQSYH